MWHTDRLTRVRAPLRRALAAALLLVGLACAGVVTPLRAHAQAQAQAQTAHQLTESGATLLPDASECSFGALHVHSVSARSTLDGGGEAHGDGDGDGAPATAHFLVAHLRAFFDQPLHVRNSTDDAGTEVDESLLPPVPLRVHHDRSARLDDSLIDEMFEVCCGGRCSSDEEAHAPALAQPLPMHAHHVRSHLRARRESDDDDDDENDDDNGSAPNIVGRWLSARNVLRHQWVPTVSQVPAPHELAFVFVLSLSEDEWEAHQDDMEAGHGSGLQCSVRMRPQAERERLTPMQLTNLQGVPVHFAPLHMSCMPAGSNSGSGAGAEHTELEWDEELAATGLHGLEQHPDEIDIFVDVENVRANEMRAAAQAAAAAAAGPSSPTGAQTGSTKRAAGSAAPASDSSHPKTVMHVYYERQVHLHNEARRHAAGAPASGSGSAAPDGFAGDDGFDPWFDPHFLADDSDLVPHLLFEARPELFTQQVYPLVHHHDRGYFGVPDVEGDDDLVEVRVSEVQRDRPGHAVQSNRTKIMRLPFAHPDEHQFYRPIHDPAGSEAGAAPYASAHSHLFVLHHEMLRHLPRDRAESQSLHAARSFHESGPDHADAVLLEVETEVSPLADLSWPAELQDTLAFLDLGSAVSVGEFAANRARAEAEANANGNEEDGSMSMLELGVDVAAAAPPAEETLRELRELLAAQLGYDFSGARVPSAPSASASASASAPPPVSLLHPEHLSDEMASALREAQEQWMDLMERRERAVDSQLLAKALAASKGRRQPKDDPAKHPRALRARRLSLSRGPPVTNKDWAKAKAELKNLGVIVQPKPKHAGLLQRKGKHPNGQNGGGRGLVALKTGNRRALYARAHARPVWGIVQTGAAPADARAGGWEFPLPYVVRPAPRARGDPDPEEWIRPVRSRMDVEDAYGIKRLREPQLRAGQRPKSKQRRAQERKKRGKKRSAQQERQIARNERKRERQRRIKDLNARRAAAEKALADALANTNTNANNGGGGDNGNGGGNGAGAGDGLGSNAVAPGADGADPPAAPLTPAAAAALAASAQQAIDDALAQEAQAEAAEEAQDAADDAADAEEAEPEEPEEPEEPADPEEPQEPEEGGGGEEPEEPEEGGGGGEPEPEGRESGAGKGAGGPPPASADDGPRGPRQVDKVVNEYEYCDLEAPFKNPTCPLPTFLMIFPNLILKIAVCVLIPPILDEFAEEFLTGQAPPIAVWNNILLQTDERVGMLSEDHAAPHDAPPAAAAAASASASSPDSVSAAPRSAFDKEVAYGVMADHISKHYWNDFMVGQRAKQEAAVPREFHMAAARAAANVDARMLMRHDRKPLGAVFNEEFTSLLASHGLASSSFASTSESTSASASAAAAAGMEQSPRAAGMEGGGEGLADGLRGKVLVPPIKAGLFNGLRGPVAANLAKQVTISVAGQVVPPVYDAVTDILRDELPDAVQHAVLHVTGNAVGMAVGTTVAESVERLLPMAPIKMLTQTLTHMLTRAVGHSLSATLLHSVGSTPSRDYYCYFCLYYSYACTQCHEHNGSSMRHAQHYGHFFSSYFGDYYADHYAKQIYDIMKKDKSS